MKTARLILLIAGCVLVPSIARASVGNLVPQQSPGNFATGAGTDHSTDAKDATVSSESRDHKVTIDSNERAGRHHVSGKILARRLPTPKSDRAKQFRQNHEQSRPEHISSTSQPARTNPAPARKVVNIHTLPVRPATGAAISGQQFRNGLIRSARPAVIGGPANTRKNSAAIKGTEVNRKHLN